jgi:amino acid transporter
VLAAFVIAARGAAAVPPTSFAPRTVFSGTVGVTIMFAFSAFIGFESAALYGEEAHNPRRSVPLATYTSVIVISVFYAFTSWVAVGAVGPAHLRSVAKHQLGNLFFMISNDFASPVLTFVMQVLLVTSLFAAILSLHNATNRYMFVLGRERVLPGWLGQVHSRHASPHRASLVQTSINVVIVGIFGASGLNPYTSLATSMIGLGTLGIVSLQAVTSVAVIGFFKDRSDRHWWRTFVAPSLGAAGLITGVVLLVRNFGVLTGAHNAVVSTLPWLLPIAAGCGVSYALWLRRSHPERYARLSATATREPADAGPSSVSLTASSESVSG